MGFILKLKAIDTFCNNSPKHHIIKKTNSIDITFESLFLFKFNFITITSTTLTNIAMVSNISSTFFLLILYFLYTLLYIYPQFQATQTLSSLNMKLYNHI